MINGLMMLMGVGVDVLEIRRVRGIRDLPRVAAFVFSEEEVADMMTHRDPVTYFASRFSLKEAVIKAYPETLSFRDFEIRKEEAKPVVRWLTPTSVRCQIEVSLSHSEEYVAGFAIVTYDEGRGNV